MGMRSYFLPGFLLLYCLIPGSITLMLSTGPQHQVAIYHLSWQASLLHPAPASLKENKTSDTYSNNAVADQQSIYTMVSYP